ncbi:MAG: hypothetical protein J5649_00995 [Lachnospiraceae bacterium]|nr:hypothetical protein [Lachnospiraceae bacterium]
MLKRCVAVLLIMALVVVSAACGKPGNETKPEKDNEQEQESKERKKNGFRRYTVELDTKGNVTSQKTLTEEYEDLITEKTYRKYRDGEVTELTRWYYDNSGEVLLKKVEWHADPYYLTVSREYDTEGRLIRYSQKQEHEPELWEEQEEIRLPEEYSQILRNLDTYAFSVFYAKFDAKELKTEYTYKDDGSIKSIQSVTENGDMIALVECGEGDIILKQEYNFNQYRYKEAYNQETGKGTWELYSENVLDEHGVWSWALELSGEVEYDKDGKATRRTEYTENHPDSTTYLSKETLYYPAGDNVQANTTAYDLTGTESYRIQSVYDEKGRETIMVQEYFGTYSNTDPIKYIVTRTYHENGEIATQSSKYFDYKKNEYLLNAEEERDADGGSLIYRQYDNLGKLEQESVTEYIQVDGIAGKVKRTDASEYTDGVGQLKTQRWYICVKNPYNEDVWFNYSYIEFDKRGNGKDNYKAEFDEEGCLIKWSLAVDEDLFTEYDVQGRPTHVREDQAGPDAGWQAEGMFEHFYEYWEGEAPQ